MASKKSNTYCVAFRRKRQGKTDYKARIGLLKSGKPRLVVRKTKKNMIVQIIQYNPTGDKILVSANSNELKKFGLKTAGGNIPCAYLVGLLIGKKALKKGVIEAIADLGIYPSTKGSRLYAVIKGAIDSGLKVPASEKILPDEKQVGGKNIEDYAKMLEEKKVVGPFTEYTKSNIKSNEISKYFADIKNKIMGGA